MAFEDYFPYVFFEEKIVEIDQAKVPIMTNALQYGNAVFGGIRGYFNQEKKLLALFRIDDHYQRFLNSLRILNVAIKYDLNQLKDITLKLVKKNQPRTNFYLRPFAYAGSVDISPCFAKNKEFKFALYLLPLGEYLSVDKGLSVVVSTWRRISDLTIPPGAKIAGGYVNSSLARQEALDNGFDDAIFLTNEGTVSEGSAANLFIVRDGTLITSPLTSDILEGITRKTVFHLAQDLGLTVVQREINRSELYFCDEAFFCGTGVQIAWIAEIDRRPINNRQKGKITEKIQELFFNVVYGNEERYAHWLTKIYL
ncbi:MAG: branched-chain amino acid transaminase [Patescibacteria group bacterium]|nr:branched-chain amino acid transaminase [Patescibacteria group bacterium]